MKKHIDKAFIIEAPEDNKEETCYLLSLNKNEVSVVNDKLGKKFTLSFVGEPLKHFVEWKSMASGDYALGLEPSSSLLDDKFYFSKIKAGETVQFQIDLCVREL